MAFRGWLLCIILLEMTLSPLVSAGPAHGEAITTDFVIEDSQSLLADPHRQIMYLADAESGELLLVDSTTCETIQSLYIGVGVSSLAISADGALLYAAVANELSIAVLDLQLLAMERTIELEFAPFSVTVGRSDRLYISCYNDSSWRIVDEATGNVLETVSEIAPPILEASPDGERLLATMTGITPINLRMYNINSDHPTLLAEGDNSLDGYFVQQDSDWVNGTLFMAGSGTQGIQLVSLGDLTRLGTMPCEGYMTGVALMPDRSVVCGLSSDYYSSEISVYDVADGVLLGTRALDIDYGHLLDFDGGGSALFIRDPLQRIPVVPSLSPLAPLEGSVLGYTPTMVGAAYTDGLPPISLAELRIEADGVDLMADTSAPSTVSGNVEWLMDEGTHWVYSSVAWMNTVIWRNWTYSIDRNDPLALRPQLIPENPAENETVDYPPTMVSARLVEPYPAADIDGAWFTVNGTLLEGRIETSLIYAGLPFTLLPGEYTVTAAILFDYGMTNDSVSWDSTVSWYQLVDPEIDMTFPDPGSEVYESPEYLEFDISYGQPAIETYLLSVQLGGRELPVEFIDEDTFRAAVDWELGAGTQHVSAALTWCIGTLYRSWEFILAEPWSLVRYEHQEGFIIPIPEGWQVVANQDIDGSVLELEVTGPYSYTVATDILVDTDRDPSVLETRAYVEDQIQAAIAAFSEEGLDGRIEWVLYGTLGGQYGVVFCTTFDLSHAAALTAIIVSEEHQRYWIVMMVFSEYEYGRANATFEDMMAGFEITAEPIGTVSETLVEMALYACIGAAAAVIGGFVVQRMMRRRTALQGEGPSTTTAGGANSQSGFCQRCGTVQTLTCLYCNNCGAALPVPPFGQVDQRETTEKGAS